MSISSKKNLTVILAAAVITATSAGAFAQSPYNDRPYNDRPYDQGRYEHDQREYDDADAAYDYARVVDVQPLTTRVRVTTPQRACWDETRVDEHPNGTSPLPHSAAGGAVLGA